MPHTIYQAGPLFSEAEQFYHITLTARLRNAGHKVVWPGNLFTERQIDKAGPHAPDLIFKGCRDAIDSCTCIVALLDGAQVDDGTAWEIGYAYAKGLPIYGLRTDFRQAGETKYNYANSMIQGCLAGLARNVEELVRLLADEGSFRHDRRVRDRRKGEEDAQALWGPVTPQLDSRLLDTRTEEVWPLERRKRDRRLNTTVRDGGDKLGDDDLPT